MGLPPDPALPGEACDGHLVRSAPVLAPEDISRFRDRVEREKAESESRIAARQREEEATRLPEDEIRDEIDEAKVAADLDPELAEDDLDRQTLARIERALERIEDGTYGISEMSGKPIPLERLEAVPYATTLVDEQPPDLSA